MFFASSGFVDLVFCGRYKKYIVRRLLWEAPAARNGDGPSKENGQVNNNSNSFRTQTPCMFLGDAHEGFLDVVDWTMGNASIRTVNLAKCFAVWLVDATHYSLIIHCFHKSGVV